MRRVIPWVVAILALAACAPTETATESPSPSVSPSEESEAPSPTPTEPPSPTGSPSEAPTAIESPAAQRVGVVTVEAGNVRVEADENIDVREYDDGSVRMRVTLDEGTPPTRLELHVEPSNLQLRVHGGVLQVADEDDELVAVMPQPQILDAEGQPVPVEMSIIDTVAVVQVSPEERHETALDVDLWFGSQLIDHVGVAASYGEPRYLVTRTPFGHALLGRGLGSTGARQVFETMGWEQAVAMEPGMRTPESLRQQYDCHVLGAATKESWNLEAYRPDFPDWLTTSLDHRCNWDEDDLPQEQGEPSDDET